MIPLALGESYVVASITVGNSGADYGYARGSYGGGPATYRGQTVDFIACTVDVYEFIFRVQGTVPQNFWGRISVEDSASVKRNFLSSQATFFQGGGITDWRFSGINEVWNATNPQRFCYIYY